MNTINEWCRIASLVCCLFLVVEGALFAGDLVTQARLIEPQPLYVDQPKPDVKQQNQETCRSRILRSVGHFFHGLT